MLINSFSKNENKSVTYYLNGLFVFKVALFLVAIYDDNRLEEISWQVKRIEQQEITREKGQS